MSNGSTSPVQSHIPQLQGQLHFLGPNWAEFDIIYLFERFQSFHAHQNYAQLLEYASKASRWLIPRRISTLEELPTEILVEIFKYMGWRDILASRQSCKHLREISTARPLWVFLFNRLSAELMAPPLLERPINAYTSDELEYVVLKRISSEVHWAGEWLPRTRRIPRKWDTIEDATLLLEGGRWLLLASPQEGSHLVYAYDLDKPLSRKPKCIITLKTAKPSRIWAMAADVDRNEPNLTFNLCLVPSSRVGNVHEAPRKVTLRNIYIYRLTLDGRGSEAKLKAHHIKTLNKGLRAGSRFVSLQGCYLARCIMSYKPCYNCIEVFDWVRSDSSVHFKSYIDLPNDYDVPKYMTLLPGGKLVTVTTTAVALYDITNLHSISADNRARDMTIGPYWTHRDPRLYFRPQMSKPYRHLATTRLAIAVKDGIYGLVVPLHSNGDPWYWPISDVNISYTVLASLGIDKFYVNASKLNGAVPMGSFIWPDEEEELSTHSLLVPVVHSRRWLFPDRWQARSFHDDRSNRLLSFAEGHCIIVDFASK